VTTRRDSILRSRRVATASSDKRAPLRAGGEMRRRASIEIRWPSGRVQNVGKLRGVRVLWVGRLSVSGSN